MILGNRCLTGRIVISEILRFLEIAGKLKETKRLGWITQAKVEQPESVADHTFRCVLMAMILDDFNEIDKCRLMQMLLLHDLQEAITGDFDALAKEKFGIEKVELRQEKAIQDIITLLPESQREELLDLWNDFHKKESAESRIAYDIDKLEMIIQALEYEKKGYSSSSLDTFWNSVQEQIKTKVGMKMFTILLEERIKLNNY